MLRTLYPPLLGCGKGAGELREAQAPLDQWGRDQQRQVRGLGVDERRHGGVDSRERAVVVPHREPPRSGWFGCDNPLLPGGSLYLSLRWVCVSDAATAAFSFQPSAFSLDRDTARGDRFRGGQPSGTWSIHRGGTGNRRPVLHVERCRSGSRGGVSTGNAYRTVGGRGGMTGRDGRLAVERGRPA